VPVAPNTVMIRDIVEVLEFLGGTLDVNDSFIPRKREGLVRTVITMTLGIGND
jgi:hypothetical protein